jgi:ketosteroid isomerase-like protein
MVKYFKIQGIMVLLSILLLHTSMQAQKTNEQIIIGILQQQEAAWNTGNLEAFMQGYWQNDSLLFIGKNGPTYGYTKTLANYKKGYPDTAYMGKFKSTILQMQPLSENCYFVVGKWELFRTIGNISGHYTLVFKKIKGEWKIVADHSS